MFWVDRWDTSSKEAMQAALAAMAGGHQRGVPCAPAAAEGVTAVVAAGGPGGVAEVA